MYMVMESRNRLNMVKCRVMQWTGIFIEHWETFIWSQSWRLASHQVPPIGDSRVSLMSLLSICRLFLHFIINQRFNQSN